MWLWDYEGGKKKKEREKAIENDEWRWWWRGLFDGDDDANDEVNNNRVVMIGLTAWVSWGDTGLDGLVESSCWKMIIMLASCCIIFITDWKFIVNLDFLTFCSGRLDVMITVWLAGSSSVELQRSFCWGWSLLVRDKMIRVVFWMIFYLLLVLDLSRSAWTSKDGDSELSAWNLTIS